jgi:hypothetical protein
MMTGEWRKLHNEELRDLYSSPSIVRIINKKNETPLFATVFVVLSTLHYYMFRPT